MPKQGVITATLTSAEGESLTVIVPATCNEDLIAISADDQNTILFAMRAAGVENAEFEFTELSDER